MDRLRAIRTFTQVAATGSFTKAAELLGLSRGAVSRQIADLEGLLGVDLLRRNTRHVSLTEVGDEYFKSCTDVLQQLDRADRMLNRTQETLSGSLRVVAKRTFGMLQLSSAVADFRAQYPEVDISLLLDDHLSNMSNLLEDSFDVAIRISPVARSSKTAKKLGTLRWVVCAAPAYLKAHGRPLQPRDLTEHNCLFHLHHLALAQYSDWRFKGREGTTVVRAKGYPSSNSVACLRTSALAGLGIALLPTYCIGDDLATRCLVTILDQFHVESRTLYAIYHPGRELPKKLRSFIQFLRERYKDPSWDAVWMRRG